MSLLLVRGTTCRWSAGTLFGSAVLKELVINMLEALEVADSLNAELVSGRVVTDNHSLSMKLKSAASPL